MVTVFGIPSFVVTLAGLLGWQGVQLLVLGDTGSINLPPSIITDLTDDLLRPGGRLGRSAIAAIAAYAASRARGVAGATAAGLEAAPIVGTVLRIGAGRGGDDRRGR